MGWSGSLTENSAVGTSTTYTPDTSAEGAYTVSAFTAPRKGIYRFQLYGSGGTAGAYAGGAGGSTTGYLLMEKGETAYIGAGGPCSAAFVSSVSGTSLAGISQTALHFVAGAGGAGAKNSAGGTGGGESGAASPDGGRGGTQSAGGAAGGSYNSGKGNAGTYGAGGAGRYAEMHGQSATSGRGGDGLYGGGSGFVEASHNSMTGEITTIAYGGGGGSGYVKNARLTVGSSTYACSTSQGGGADSGGRGSIVVTYYARTGLPVVFSGTQLDRLFYNGEEPASLVFNGVKLYMRRWKECLRLTGARSGFLRAIRGSSRFALRA